MTTLQLGMGAYRRKYGGMPEVKCINRFVEMDPLNMLEKVALLARPGTKQFQFFQPDTVDGKMRGLYSQIGIFDDDGFAVSGQNLYRYQANTQQHIGGAIMGGGTPSADFVAGVGYERMFIADGLLLNYYDGGTHASGVLTDDGSTNYAVSILNIGGTFYSWNTNVEANAPSGLSAAHPWLCLPGASGLEALANMADLLNFEGTPGVDFSSGLTTANTIVSAVADPSVKILTLTALSDGVDGNLIVTSVSGTTHLSWSGATLAGGGTQALHGVQIPTGEAAKCVAQLDSYMFVSVSNSNKFFYVKPGAVVIDALDFATKESAPDPILDMKRMGDVMVIMGSVSTEFWAATGNADNPFAPIEGRTLSRGIIEGTAVSVNDSLICLVGNDGKVYKLESGLTTVSDNGMDERIRIQLRREAGLN